VSRQILELRVYTLKAGTRPTFEQRFAEQIEPMLQRHGINVVAAGPSLHDTDSFCLVRAFPSLEARERQLADFYGSEEWLDRHDDAVMAMIDHYSTCVVPADALRAQRGMTAPVLLFSYGTLRQKAVQLANYGRELDGAPDALVGYRLQALVISDPRVVELSGKAVHNIACATGNPADRIEGVVFELSREELESTDAYEVDAYARVEVILESGRNAFVYVAGEAR
jgi:gamma-glutamylcyclotransferase (GGCT)/AIG2-like uncharacterized protein YtfP